MNGFEALLLPVDRAVAVRRLAGHLADRDAFLVFGGEAEHTPLWLDRLGALPDWHVWLDNGGTYVRRVPGEIVPVALVADALFGTVSMPVAVVPKTVPATALSDALGKHVPDDGSQDLVALVGKGNRIDWPVLFLDALAEVDPAAAMQIIASDRGRQS